MSDKNLIALVRKRIKQADASVDRSQSPIMQAAKYRIALKLIDRELAELEQPSLVSHPNCNINGHKA